jgi:hypothetical protein
VAVTRPRTFAREAPLSWGFCPRPRTLRPSARACLSRDFFPPRSGTCSSQALASLPFGSAPLTDFRRLPRCFASTSRLSSSRRSLASPGVTRPSACCPSSGFLLWARFPFGARRALRPSGSTHGVVASVFAERWPCTVAFSVSHRSGEARRRRLAHPLEVRSLSPSCVGDLGFCVSTGGAET